MRLEAHNVTAGYNGRPVLRAVRLAVETGEMVGLIGPNGSGKSTLLRVLSGALVPLEGQIRLNGQPLNQLSSQQRAKQIAFVPQNEPATFDFTVHEVVLMGRYPHRLGKGLTEEDYRIAHRAMAEVDVLALAERPITQLSGGEHRRVLLARALAQEAPLLLLDEPTAHLDITHQIELLQQVRRMTRRVEQPIGVLAALHDLNQAAEFCDLLVLLHRGQIEAVGAPQEVLTPAHLLRVYEADVQVGLNPITGKLQLLSLRPARERAERPDAPRVHVLCGGGSGVGLMGVLVRHGYRVTVGPLNRYDTDQIAAEALGLETVLEAPFAPLSRQACEEALALIAQAEVVFIAPVPFGYGNLAVLELALTAQSQGKCVVLLGDERFAARDFTGGKAEKLLQTLLQKGARLYSHVEQWLEQKERQEPSEDAPSKKSRPT